jgi:hypothetical protein
MSCFCIDFEYRGIPCLLNIYIYYTLRLKLKQKNVLIECFYLQILLYGVIRGTSYFCTYADCEHKGEVIIDLWI